MRYLALLCLLFSGVVVAQVPTLTFTAETTTGNGSVIPKLTWSTAPAATQCVASGDWIGTRNPSGSQTLAAITTSKTYNLSCTWEGNNQATLTWKAPVKNTDESSLTDLKGYRLSWGTSITDLSNDVTIDNPAAVSHVMTMPGAGTYHYTLRAVNQRGVESVSTTPVSKTIGPTNVLRTVAIAVNPVPMAPTNFQVQ